MESTYLGWIRVTGITKWKNGFNGVWFFNLYSPSLQLHTHSGKICPADSAFSVKLLNWLNNNDDQKLISSVKWLVFGENNHYSRIINKSTITIFNQQFVMKYMMIGIKLRIPINSFQQVFNIFCFILYSADTTLADDAARLSRTSSITQKNFTRSEENYNLISPR